MYSITTLSKLTGVNAATIRSWERRYEIIKPGRQANGRRCYSDADIRRLNLVASLVQAGHSIGQIAGLSLQELESLGEHTDIAAITPQARLVKRIMDAVASYDVNEFRQLIGIALLSLPPAQSVETVIVPVLQQIGEGWSQGKVDVGLEHALTAIVKQMLLSSINVLHWSGSGQRMAFATLSGELHELGCVLAWYLAATKGKDCIYYGPNMPVTDLAKSVDAINAEVLVLSAVCTSDGQDPRGAIMDLARTLPDSVEIWLGCSEHSGLLNGELPQRLTVFTSFGPFVNRLA